MFDEDGDVIENYINTSNDSDMFYVLLADARSMRNN